VRGGPPPGSSKADAKIHPHALYPRDLCVLCVLCGSKIPI
jgi:hypothetical protein